ncbi:MAG TPA: hypothetical protein VES67_07275 [Vicinamibacterales bacterium]|nr:hypothetical protein [Vicinamibacterales bacterium]
MDIDVIELIRPETMRIPINAAQKGRQAWFLGFHRAVNQITLRERVALGMHSVVIFSDSVFLVGDEAGIVHSATSLMRLCMLQRIPVRMGIGYGTWTELHFGSSFSAKRRQHAARFFGSGVTSAYYAEHKGGKGLRIFVHPKAATALRSCPQLMALPPRDRNEYASHELNFVKRRGGGQKNQMRSFLRLKACVEEMEEAANREDIHYRSTRPL